MCASMHIGVLSVSVQTNPFVGKHHIGDGHRGKA